ncbi:MAG: RtcB family protein [Candidatus Niyogibacteria bacterium]|nr:RtcB family protein [Candidatus Niyogibacteria bacterium]
MVIKDFKKINDHLWEISRSFREDMRVPARIYATEKMLLDSLEDRSAEQLVNVATLPGIYKYALAMPDIHEGYGFPIGGVAAMDAKNGVISPGGIGYDINCGVRLLRSDLAADVILPRLNDLGGRIFAEVPSGAGRSGILKLSGKDLDLVLKCGARGLVAMGYEEKEDLEFIESGGELPDADPAMVSSRAKTRGQDQLGTMGAGNHFVEVGFVEKIFSKDAAEAFGLFLGQVTVLIHTGSRGLGHQVATDHIRTMMAAMPKYGIRIPDRELACAPFRSEEGQNYFKAMSAAANFAWANRQLIAWEVRKAWKDILGDSGGELKTVYDVAHNLAKIEKYESLELLVHRKGATGSFAKGNSEIPSRYRNVGQPVLIPGSMGTASYILAGAEGAMENTFGTAAHGAGRSMSRTEARKHVEARALRERLEAEGIYVFAGSLRGIAEEAPAAYKDIDSVVDTVEAVGMAKKVARLRPLAVIKG